jgi:hypothetical protein
VDRLSKNLQIAWYRFIAEKEETSEVKDVLAFLRKEVISQERKQASEGMGSKGGSRQCVQFWLFMAKFASFNVFGYLAIAWLFLLFINLKKNTH